MMTSLKLIFAKKPLILSNVGDTEIILLRTKFLLLIITRLVIAVSQKLMTNIVLCSFMPTSKGLVIHGSGLTSVAWQKQFLLPIKDFQNMLRSAQLAIDDVTIEFQHNINESTKTNIGHRGFAFIHDDVVPNQGMDPVGIMKGWGAEVVCDYGLGAEKWVG